MNKGTAYILVLALPVDGMVFCVLPVLPIGRPSTLLSLCTFVFFIFFLFYFIFFILFFLFVLLIFKAQTNNDNLPKFHNIEHNPAGRMAFVWRRMEVDRRSCDVVWASLLAGLIPCWCELKVSTEGVVFQYI